MRQFEYPHTNAELAANPWQETTEEHYYDMLGCVPPARQSGTAFAVGEALCHTDDGRVVYDTFIEIDGKFYCKPCAVDSFDPITFEREVRNQLAE